MVTATAASIHQSLGLLAAPAPMQTPSERAAPQSEHAPSLRRLGGGQFSRRMPRDRPREASTSLISVSDFLPRFGVFNSSTSVR